MDFFSMLLIVFFLLPLYILTFFRIQNPSKKPISTGIKAYPLLGNLPDFLKNRHRFLDWMTQVLRGQPTNTVTFRRPGGVRGVITANPMNIEYMLKTNFQNFPKGKRSNYLLEDFLGGGIFNSDGEKWKMQRKTASFEFNTKSLRNFVIDSVHFEIEDRLLPLLQRVSRENKTIDLQDVLERFAFDNVCKVAFNEDPSCLAEGPAQGPLSPVFALAFQDAANLSCGRFYYAIPYFWKIKKFLNIGSERRLKEAISIVHDFAAKIIRSRKNGSPSPDDDLLSRFIADNKNSEEFLRDIIVSFILAGRDTTSSTLSWFFWLLSSRPDIEQNILDELKRIRAQAQSEGGGKTATYSYEDLREMHYLHAALSETLRLYPPVAVDQKACLNDDVLPDGTFIGKGWFMTYNSYAMGRMESIWGKDCTSFVPERWLENGIFQPESPFRYPAFHAGPRMCLGKEMAYIQMKSIAACMIERFEIDVLEKDTCPEHMLSLTLRMKFGLPIRVRERCMSMDGV